jgi:hypothetical protein
MRRLLLVVILLLVSASARGDAQIDGAIHALRRDSSLKVRTQAAIVLGQRAAPQAVAALREAVAGDDAAAVRIAAVGALAKIGERAARPTLRQASEADPDASVRRAATRALAELGPISLAIDEPAGPFAARDPLRHALGRHLAEHGFAVGDPGELRLKPTVKVDFEESASQVVIAVRTSLVVVDGDGRVDMMEAGARASVAGPRPTDAKLAGYSARAIDAAARTLSEDLAAKLGAR